MHSTFSPGLPTLLSSRNNVRLTVLYEVIYLAAVLESRAHRSLKLFLVRGMRRLSSSEEVEEAEDCGEEGEKEDSELGSGIEDEERRLFEYSADVCD